MLILILATVVLVLNWTVEYIRHYRHVKAIPIRIHVNGTRGKSSVTRLIAAGLRAGNVKTIAKTTGTMPRVIMPDGTESSIVRLMGANIIEQKYIFRFASTLKPQAIVIECMAVNPIYQWITERMFVKSTISVITNCRADHMDLMGATVESVTMCLSNTIPENGYCFTAEEDHFKLLKKVAKTRNTEIHKIRPTDVTAEELHNFPYIEHAENLQLALAVCEKVGVPRAVALKGMQKATPDPGALKKYRVEDRQKRLYFYNVFAANDPDSTGMIWNMICGKLHDVEKIVILNGRADRFFRTEQLVDACLKLDFSYLVLSGELTDKAMQYAMHVGIPKEKLMSVGEMDPAELYEKLHKITRKESHIVGIGNIAGRIKYGAMIVRYFRDRCVTASTERHEKHIEKPAVAELMEVLK
jgi:poly-gamma-glutamate synthase PgsB/CapB